MKILVSACLVGDNCKYNGQNNYNQKIVDYLRDKDYIKICPECMGGLTTPRKPSEIVNNRVINQSKEDVTEFFRRGALLTLKLANREKPSLCILKSNSPSCGVKAVYDGTFSRKLTMGNGITAELLIKHGFKVISSDEFIKMLDKQEL